MMSAILYARNSEFTYLHTPLANLDHAIAPVKKYAVDWESFIGLGMNECPVERFHSRTFERKATHSLNELEWQNGVLYQVPHCHAFADEHPQLYEALRHDLRSRYWHNKTGGRSNRDRLRIVIHARRGDVTPCVARRFTPNEDIERTLRGVSDALDHAAIPYQAELVSEGATDDFAGISIDPDRLFLNGDPKQAFHKLVTADVMIMGKSSFSYVAGILCEGTVVYPPFWSAPLPSWLVLDEDHGIDRARLLKAVRGRHNPGLPSGTVGGLR